MPWFNKAAVEHLAPKASKINSCMAKSEIPCIVVQSGGGSTNNHCDMEQQCPSSRPSRLEKQEEFEVEEDVVYMPSPVTIQIEDRDNRPDVSGNEVECGVNGNKPEAGENVMGAEKDEFDGSGVVMGKDGETDENRLDRSKVTSRVKLLVRSQAVHDDASPPPDLETVITNTNMLSVTNAPAFATQTQSKSSNKKRLGREGSSQGSQGSTESSSGLSRDSSTETYTDSTGIDLQQFIIDTLHKNQKDRIMMFKIEQDLIALVKDPKRHSYKFGQMSSYNRMLVHRVAAFFGMDHYVDASGNSVIVNKTKTTRLPEVRFQDHCRDELFPEEPKKSILKRDSISFEEGKEQKSPERQSSTDSRRSKSFEEREEEYEKARARIFNKDEGLGESPISRRSSQEDIRWPSSDTRPWSSTDSDSSGRPPGAKVGSSFETEAPQPSPATVKAERPVALLSKAESDNKELLIPNRMVRPVMTKASSFGGISVLSREGSVSKNITPRITKAESFNMTSLSCSRIASCSVLQPQATVTSTPSPHFVSSSIGIPTTCVSQYSTAPTLQTFPMVAGQPTQLHIPIQQFSSQVSGWPVASREATATSDYSVPTAGGQQPLMWPVSTATDLVFPNSIVINPQSGVPYVNVDNVIYRYKMPATTGGQTVMLTPFQQIAMPPPNQVPISSHITAAGSNVSPPTQHAQTPHQGLPPNLHLTLAAQQQTQQPQPVQIQQAQTPAVVYVPYIPSQIQSPILSQPSIGNAAATVQSVQQPMQAQPSQQTQLLPDQRTYIVNPGSVDELTAQMPGLGLIPTHISLAQQQEPLQPAGRSFANIDPSSTHSYGVPTFKSQGYVSPQGNIAPFPVYYMQQVQQPTVRCVYPATSSVTQQGHGQNAALCGQMVADMQSHVTQTNTQVTGPQYLTSYPILALSQTGDTPAPSTYVSYTLASQTSAVTTTTSVLVPSSPMSIPIYPYGNMVIGNLNNVAQPSFTSPVTTQPSQQTPTYVQTPIAVQTPSASALPMYVITTSAAQTPVAQTHLGSSGVAGPFASYRSQSLPTAPSTGSATSLGAQLSANSSAMGYAIYSTQHLPAAAVATPHTSITAIGQQTQTSQSTSQLAPAILTTFQVLRPNMPLVGAIRSTRTPPPPAQNLMAQYTTQPSSTSKVPLSFPLVKQASDPGVDCFGLGNGRLDQTKGNRSSQMHAMSCRPTSGLVCPRSVPVMQDLCLIGHPLQQHFSPIMLSQQRPLSRFMHPTGSNTLPSTRPPKNRSKRNKGSQSSGSSSSSIGRNGASFQPMHDIAGHMLEIEGLPEGMKRSEMERYLEQVTCHGAKIQFLDVDSGNILSSEIDFIVSARHLVVAVFESDTAAQSALLGIKTPKFQLRPLRRSTRDVSQKKYS